MSRWNNGENLKKVLAGMRKNNEDDDNESSGNGISEDDFLEMELDAQQSEYGIDFTQWDTNGDKFLEKTEMAAVKNEYTGEALSDTEWNWILENFDLNVDGKLNKQGILINTKCN